MIKDKTISIVDYSCHPFSLDLAYNLSKINNLKVYYFFSKEVCLTGNYYKLFKSKNLIIKAVSVGNFPKYNFLIRRSKELEFGKKIITYLKQYKIDKAILANVPIDPLYKIIKYSKNNKIETYFWIQDIYHLAIKNVLKKNSLIFFVIGFLISKYYKYLETFCFINSTKNIVITNKFLKFFPKINKNFVIENWAPLAIKKSLKLSNKKFLKINKKKFTFLYSGTFSYKHHSYLYLELAKKMKDCNIIILSKDKFAKELKIIAQNQKIENIYFYETVSYEQLNYFFNFTDVGLVNLNEESNNVCVPSKVLTYYKNSIPVLASIPMNNLASINIKKFNTGLVSNPNDNISFFKNALKLKNNYKLRKKFSDNCLNFSINNFNINEISKRFKKIINL